MERHIGITILLWAAFLFMSPAQAAPEFPALSSRVVDQAGLLSRDAESRLSAMLAQHEQATSNQVVVVTLSSLQGYPIETYGYQLGRHWGIGQKGKNNGVLLIVAPTERKVRIEVGYGLEGTLTDALSKNIIETVITPRFKKGDMEGGIVAGTRAILGTIEGTYKPEPRNRGRGVSRVNTAFDYFAAAVIVVMVFGGFVHRIIKNRFIASALLAAIAWLVGMLVFSMAIGIFAGIVVFLIQLFTGLGPGGGDDDNFFGGGYYGGGYSSGGYSGGGFSSGGFSGGGGGFGGGGASGGW